MSLRRQRRGFHRGFRRCTKKTHYRAQSFQRLADCLALRPTEPAGQGLDEPSTRPSLDRC